MKIYNKKKLDEILLRGKILLCTATVALTTGCTPIGGGNEGALYDDSNAATEYIQELSDEELSASFAISNVTTNDLLGLPVSLQSLEFYNCQYIEQLSMLPEICPNLTELEIDLCASVTNLDFIYELENLEDLYVANCIGVSQELVDYLDSKGINHNITAEDIEIANKIDIIYNEIIDDNMTNEEKIQAISVYVFKNYDYDLKYSKDSNFEPLKCMLNNGKGVCYGYAYLTEVLLSKAGIDSSVILTNDHAWNLVKEDDKYYYLDVTNMQIAFLPEHFNFGFNYMISPTVNYGDAILPYDSGDGKIVIPKEIIKEIETSEDTKSIMDKYFTGMLGTMFKCALPVIGVGSAVSGTKFAIGKTTEYIEDEKRRRKLRKQRRLEEKRMKEEERQRKKEMIVHQKELERQRKNEMIAHQKELKQQRKEELRISKKQQIKVVDFKKEISINSSPQEEVVVETPKEPEIIKQEPKKELSPYELMINDMMDSFDKCRDFRSVLFRDYNYYLMNNEYITFIDYLKMDKRYDTKSLIIYEEKKLNIINSVYQEFTNFYPDSVYDIQLFIYYCKNRSKLIKDLGGVDLVIYTSDLEMFIDNLMRANDLENNKTIS